MGNDQNSKPIVIGNINFDLSSMISVQKSNQSFKAKLPSSPICDQLELTFNISIIQQGASDG